jgi:hypothetical protein
MGWGEASSPSRDGGLRKGVEEVAGGWLDGDASPHRLPGKEFAGMTEAHFLVRGDFGGRVFACGDEGGVT